MTSDASLLVSTSKDVLPGKKGLVAASATSTISFEDLSVTFGPGSASDSAIELKRIPDDIPSPWRIKRISPIYQIELADKAILSTSTSYQVRIGFATSSIYFKQIFWYDGGAQKWKPIFTKEAMGKKFVQAKVNFGFVRIAVFENSAAQIKGKATWYKYKGGNFAASPDFPKGSRLRVFNLDNNKFVDIVVNDYGPDRKLFPQYTIDLDKEAFKKIAKTGAGVINTWIEPLYIPSDNIGRVLGVKVSGESDSVVLKSLSGIVYNESTDEIVWNKNATSTLPLASLTKMVAIKTFLDTRPSLNSVIKYSKKDEQENLRYAKIWELAKLNVKDGETMTIEDLLYSALLGSANNAVESLVRVSGLKRDDFIAKMNENVALWGARSTHFEEPTGLSPKNVSSVLDYAIITKEVFKNPIIEKASKMPKYKFSTINTKNPHTIRNSNQLIQLNKYNITGSKTGYLVEAGYCLMTRSKAPNGQSLIAITFGSPNRNLSFSETEELMEYGYSKLLAKK